MSSDPLSDKTILLIDDDVDILEGTSRILKMQGSKILKAATGSEGLEAIKNDHPDLIMLNIEESEKRYRHLFETLSDVAKKAKENEIRFRLAFEHSNEGMCLVGI